VSALLNLQEAAKYLDINRHLMGSYVRQNLIRSVTLPDTKTKKFRVEDLDEFAAQFVGPKDGPLESAETRQEQPGLAPKRRAPRSGSGKSFKYEVGWHERVGK